MFISRRAFMGGMLLSASSVGLPNLQCIEEKPSVSHITPYQPIAFDETPPETAGMHSSRLAEAYAFIEAEMDGGQFPGVALAVTRHGKLVTHRYWGTCWTSQGPNAAFTPEAYSILYSFTKIVSMTVAARVHDAGLLDFDAPVREYIPEFTGGGKDAITIRRLLTHSAGLPALRPMPVYTQAQWDAGVELCCAAEIEWEPGSRTAYHGASGLFIVAEAIRRLQNGAPWEQICHEWLFEPLGTARLTGRLPEASHRLAITPPPEHTPAPLDENVIPVAGHPAAGFMGTPIEMLQLLNLYLNQGVWNGNRLLASATVDETLRIQYQEAIELAISRGEPPAHEHWGLGWLIRGDSEPDWFGLGSVTSSRTFGHAGIDTVIGVADPETGLALAFLTTAPPKSYQDTIRIRNEVTDRVARAVVA